MDATEKLTQLNRPTINNLLGQVTYLTAMLFNQLGLTETIFNGTADEKTMLNYRARTITPVVNAIVDNLTRKFITKTGQSQGQRIVCLRDPFRFVPVTELAAIADTTTRNAILSSNDFRAVLNYSPSAEPDAEKLTNKNIAQSSPTGNNDPVVKEGIQNDSKT